MKLAMTRGRVLSWHRLRSCVWGVVITTSGAPMTEYVSVVSDGYFTREDVESLRLAAKEWEQAGDMGHYWANGLADRLEALLPPEEK